MEALNLFYTMQVKAIQNNRKDSSNRDHKLILFLLYQLGLILYTKLSTFIVKKNFMSVCVPKILVEM